VTCGPQPFGARRRTAICCVALASTMRRGIAFGSRALHLGARRSRQKANLFPCEP